MINDMDTQQKYGIMSIEDIEHAFNQIERRIGVHERDVIVLEDRTRAFSDWWMEKNEPPPVIEETPEQKAHWAQMLEWAAQKDREYRQFAEEQEQAEAPKVISGKTGGEDAI
jgi:hypothetical protein